MQGKDMDNLNIGLYKKLYLIRRAEEKIRRHYHEDEMKTPVHLSIGKEAIEAGVCSALRSCDQIFGTYRSHGIYLAKKGETDAFFAELYGKQTGMLKGKGGSMHLSDPGAGFMGTSAIVGSIIPVAAGTAYVNKKKKNGKVVAVFFGDGATEEGVFWESLNIACLMSLPILFVCEDNELAVFTLKSCRQSYKSISDIVSQFDCNVLKAKSTDVEVIYNMTRDAIKSINDTQRPCFLHLKYYRYLEHVGVNEDFDAGYRSKTEFENWRRVDPVNLQKKKILEIGYGKEEIKKIEEEIDNQIENSVSLAKKASFAPLDELLKEIFA